MLTHSPSIRSKRFLFNPNIMMQPMLGADPLIVSTLQALGDKLRDDKFCELAVISCNNASVISAVKWILDGMNNSRKTPSLKPKITQSASNTSPILVAASPVQTSGVRYNLMESVEFCDDEDDDNDVLCHKKDDDDNKEEDIIKKRIKHIVGKKRKRHIASIPPLSIGRSSYNEEEEDLTPATVITITPTNMPLVGSQSVTIGNISRQRSLLSQMDADQEIISMSSATSNTIYNNNNNRFVSCVPYTPPPDDDDEDDDEEEEDKDSSSSDESPPTPPSFTAYNLSASIHSVSAYSAFGASSTKIMHISSLIDLYESTLCHIVQFLSFKERIQCAKCSRFMKDLVFRDCNFSDIWLTFDDDDDDIKLINKHYIAIAMTQIQFIDKIASDKQALNEINVNFNQILTRTRSNNNYGKIVRFQNGSETKHKHIQQRKRNRKRQKQLKYFNKLWIWNAIHCLELNNLYNNCSEWQLLCKYKLSKSITFLSLDMRSIAESGDIANFALICKYFPHLEHLNLCNLHYISSYRDLILEFFKLRTGSEWEQCESSLIKLKGIEFKLCDDLIFKLLSSTLQINSARNGNKFICESLFTQLITLQIDECNFQFISHLQILLDGCCNVKYLSLCNISITHKNEENELPQFHALHMHESNSGANKNSVNGGASFIDRVERSMFKKSKQKEKEKEETHNIPQINIPKSVKYFKIYHKFSKDNISYGDFSQESGHFSQESTDSTISSSTTYSNATNINSNHSTPVLFAMDDLCAAETCSPVLRSVAYNKHMHTTNINSHKKHQSINYKMKQPKMSFPQPPFYCNLSQRNRNKKLIHVCAEINDANLLNQIFAASANNLKSLKYLTLNYSCAEHNGYLNFAEFIQFYSNQYKNYGNQTKHINTLILNNALFDEYKLSINKIKCSQFFKEKFHKNENEIIKEEHFAGKYCTNFIYTKNHQNELVFIEKLTKCSDFFKSRILKHDLY